jgi:hypothetical protein
MRTVTERPTVSSIRVWRTEAYREDSPVKAMVFEDLLKAPAIQNAVKSFAKRSKYIARSSSKGVMRPRAQLSWTPLVNALGIIGSLLVLVQLADKYQWVLYVYPAIIVTAFLLPFWSKISGYWKIRRDLALAERLLKERGIHPERIIAFDRTSGIFAGMLAQRLELGEVVLLPRTTTRAPKQEGGRRQISVGKGLALTGPGIAHWNSLVVVFHLRRGDTLEAANRFFEEQGHPFQGNILAIYATKEGRTRWPRTIAVHLINEGFVPSKVFPWIGGKYNPV